MVKCFYFYKTEKEMKMGKLKIIKIKKISFFLNFFLFFAIFIPTGVQADNLSERLSGRILLNVEKNGEAWYVYPIDKKRHYLGRPADAFQIMRELGLGISERDFQRIAQVGMPVSGDFSLARKLAGRIILQVEKNGEAWYINPVDLKKYYLGRPADAFRIMRELGLGISRENLARIHKPGLAESINQYSRYEHKKIRVADSCFSIDLVEIDLSNPCLKIITDAAEPYPSEDKNGQYGAQSLGEFVIKNNGFAGINGSYFCSYDSCEAPNYYFYPVFDSLSQTMVNESQLKYWTTGPIIAFNKNNKFYYFKDSREFKSLDNFERTFNTKLQAAIGNKPRLIENYMNLLIEWGIDDKQKNLKSTRNAIAYKNNKIYLIVAHNATVPELAEIIKAMEMEYALNLDGGYSSALFYNDEYMVGPGRDIPNAIIFKEECVR